MEQEGNFKKVFFLLQIYKKNLKNSGCTGEYFRSGLFTYIFIFVLFV